MPQGTPMLLTAEQIAQARDHTLANLTALSSAWSEASQRFSSLLTSASQDAVHQGSKHAALFAHSQLESITHFPTTVWLENSGWQNRLLDHSRAIFGETHKALIQGAEAQIRVVDGLVFSSLNCLAKNRPSEDEPALNTGDQTEQDHQIKASLTGNKPNKSRLPRRPPTNKS